ncbi:MAG: tyrosine--tRNA ligase [Anaerovoracaceae bacterium]|nr:tyrosine--tRNA ligase [Anaerovoracaceae bacterium]
MVQIPDSVSKYTNVYDVLKERGFIEQCTNEEEVRDMLGREKIKFYIGFDPTADSLHIGHFMQTIIMMYMQKYGHTPIVLIGGGTTMVGDPSGRTDMRKMMTQEQIQENGRKFVKLFERYLDFDQGYEYYGHQPTDGPDAPVQNKEPEPGKAICVDNAKWLLQLNYVEFVREIGRHFSVNEMLRAECYKQRLEKGLSFLEFNYMLMQSYDFYVMSHDLDCKMQFGGNDQWSNILGGIDLVRRKDQKTVYGLTFSLLTNYEGKKMGKTGKGTLWLNPEKTSPYEFYQYWRNVNDADVEKCLRMLTFLPMDEVRRLASLPGEEINHAKEVLAFEVTKLVHGEEEAIKAQEGARAAFEDGTSIENMPTTKMDVSDFEGDGIGVLTLMCNVGLASSNSDARRTVEQGGLTVQDQKITDPKTMITQDMFNAEGKLIMRKGKKVYHVIDIK